MTRRLFILAAMALSGLVAAVVRDPACLVVWAGLNLSLVCAWRLR
jgi:hypothetical protein